VDKTGTLTEHKPVLEETIFYGSESLAPQFLAGYIFANRDTTEIVTALRPRAALQFFGQAVGALPFSSERKYGAAWLRFENQETAVVLGAPDVLFDNFSDDNEKIAVKGQVDFYAGKAKRLILLATAPGLAAGSPVVGKVLRPVALYVLFDPLRPGTENIIDYFQKKDVRIRVISGDNPRTVQAVANQAGMKYSDLVVTGQEMESWDDTEYEERVPAFHLFARIKPAQKEKIISLLKRSGYTAMVGDGANDALAIKKADLGVAMFDGAPATRQIAQVVLMNNSFAALPKGVALAEAIILNIELVASVFFNKVVVGLTLFLVLAFMGYTFPLSPSNMTVINYFTIWLPLAYWTFFPVSNRGFDARSPFMAKILLFSAVNGIIMALAAIAVFVLQPQNIRHADSNSLVMLALIFLGYLYFVLAPLNYGIMPSFKRLRALVILGAASALLAGAIVFLPALSKVFGLRPPTLMQLLLALAIISVFGYAQYAVARRWFYKAVAID
jgi:cation-transporting ATPase E